MKELLSVYASFATCRLAHAYLAHAYNVFIFFYFLSHVFDILVIYLPKKLLNGFDKFAKHTRSYVNFKEYT